MIYRQQVQEFQESKYATLGKELQINPSDKISTEINSMNYTFKDMFTSNEDKYFVESLMQSERPL